MAKVNYREIKAALDEEHSLERELESDELDREHRELDTCEGVDIELEDDWYDRNLDYDWFDDGYDPYPLVDDFHD